MIQVNYKLDTRTLWVRRMLNTKYWIFMAFYILLAAVVTVLEMGSTGLVATLIKNDSIKNLLQDKGFYGSVFIWLIVYVLFPIVIILTLPPLQSRKIAKYSPDYVNTFVFDKEKIANEISYNGQKTHIDIPYTNIKSVKRRKDSIIIMLKYAVCIFDDAYINGSPAELESLLKEKCGNKYRSGRS